MIYLIRHGEIDAGDRYIGRTDLPLTRDGEGRIKKWCAVFNAFSLRAIYCSRMIRSHRSARIIRGERDIPVYPMPALNEISLGKWEGVPIRKIKTRYPEEWTARGKQIDTFRPENGESFGDLSKRVIPAFESVVEKAGDENILIVGHAGVNRVILCHVLKMPLNCLFRLAQDYGGLNIIEEKASAYHLKLMNFSIENNKQIDCLP
ncbi:MAG: histidine phosphatase family protein [Deltaproteobacteria bacterium]|nr:histidine phosphatase family protein [Deltaproteobacteria bacterium]